MKTPIIALISLVILAMASSPAHAGVDPSSLIMKLYAISIFPNEDCSGTPTTISFGESGSLKDFVQDPTLGFTNIAKGTYSCLVFKMGDTISFTPASSVGSICTAGTSYSLELCRDGMTTRDPTTGAITACTTGVEDTVFLYISAWSTSTGNEENEPFLPPTAASDADHGIKLDSALVVSDNTTGQFVFGAKGKVGEDPASPGTCGMSQPTFGFSKKTAFAPPPAGSCVTDVDCNTWASQVLMRSNMISPIRAIIIRSPSCVSFLAGNYCTVPCHPASPDRGIDLAGVCSYVDRGYYLSEHNYTKLKPDGESTTMQCTTEAGDTSCSSGNSTCYCLYPTWIQ